MVWIEGDSNSIIKCLKGENRDSWTIENLIKSSIEIIQIFERSFISHAHRKLNTMVDCLANLGMKSKSKSTWYGEDTLVGDVKALLSYDQTHGKIGNLHTFFDDAIR